MFYQFYCNYVSDVGSVLFSSWEQSEGVKKTQISLKTVINNNSLRVDK